MDLVVERCNQDVLANGFIPVPVRDQNVCARLLVAFPDNLSTRSLKARELYE